MLKFRPVWRPNSPPPFQNGKISHPQKKNSSRSELGEKFPVSAEPFGLVCAENPRLSGEPCPGLLLFSWLASSARTALACRVNLARAAPLPLVGLVCAGGPRLPGEPCSGLLLFSCLASSARTTLSCSACFPAHRYTPPGGRPVWPIRRPPYLLPPSYSLLPTPYSLLPTPYSLPAAKPPGSRYVSPADSTPAFSGCSPCPFIPSRSLPALFPVRPAAPLWPIFYLPALPFYLLSPISPHLPLFPRAAARTPAHGRIPLPLTSRPFRLPLHRPAAFVHSPAPHRHPS